MALGFPVKIVIIFSWLKKIKFNYRNYQKGRNRIHTNCWKVDERKYFLYNISSLSFYLKQQQHLKKEKSVFYWETA